MKQVTFNLKKEARKAILGTRVRGFRGRSDGAASVTYSTPVDIIPNSADKPKAKGLPYWKTNFNNGKGFRKTLYTPSTFRVEVGENWKPAQKGS
jgi:hypothetical protein